MCVSLLTMRPFLTTETGKVLYCGNTFERHCVMISIRSSLYRSSMASKPVSNEKFSLSCLEMNFSMRLASISPRSLIISVWNCS